MAGAKRRRKKTKREATTELPYYLTQKRKAASSLFAAGDPLIISTAILSLRSSFTHFAIQRGSSYTILPLCSPKIGVVLPHSRPAAARPSEKDTRNARGSQESQESQKGQKGQKARTKSQRSRPGLPSQRLINKETATIGRRPVLFLDPGPRPKARPRMCSRLSVRLCLSFLPSRRHSFAFHQRHSAFPILIHRIQQSSALS